MKTLFPAQRRGLTIRVRFGAQRLLTGSLIILSVLTLFQCGSDGGGDPANQKPVIENLSPVNETLIKNGPTITLSADVSDPDGTITKVEFLINGTVVGQTETEPYEFE